MSYKWYTLNSTGVIALNPIYYVDSWYQKRNKMHDTQICIDRGSLRSLNKAVWSSFLVQTNLFSTKYWFIDTGDSKSVFKISPLTWNYFRSYFLGSLNIHNPEGKIKDSGFWELQFKDLDLFQVSSLIRFMYDVRMIPFACPSLNYTLQVNATPLFTYEIQLT